MAKTSKTTKPVTTDVVALMKDFPASFAKLDQEHAQIVSRMDELKRAGLIYATTYWRKKIRADGQEVRFMYLHYPATAGKERDRVYIGSEQSKIDDSLASIERAKEYDSLARQRAQIEARIEHVQEALMEAMAYLENENQASSWSGRYGGGHHYRAAYA